ncbi:MAG: hypothetical protein ABW026_09010 [Microvirga sp.]
MKIADMRRHGRQGNVAPLPAAILEHLGRKLRATYHETSERPKFVGDPALPLEFDPLLYRLYQKERTFRLERAETTGLAAVAVALGTMSL